MSSWHNGVILSEAKDLARWAKMLRCAQHDSVLDLPVTQRLYYFR
jgi:hypothetical protein